MPIDASVYSQLEPSKLATLGEIAEARAVREDRQVLRDTRTQALKKQQRDLAEQEAVETAFRENSGPDGPDQKKILAKLYQTAPTAAPKVEAQFTEMRQKATADKKSQLDMETERAKAVSRNLQGATPQTYPAIISRIKRIDPEAAQELGDTFDPARIEAVTNAGMAWSEYNTKYKDALERDDKDIAKVLNVMSLAADPEHWADAWEMGKVLGVSSELRQMGLSDQFAPDAPKRAGALTQTPEKRSTLESAAADRAADNARQGATAAETARHNRAMEARAAATGGGGSSDVDDLVDTVIKEPGLWDQLTPTVKGKIAPKLAAKGYEGFGKPLSDGAMKQIAESESAVQSLQDLRVTLQKNEQYIGPIAGFQALNPYSAARQAQAEIDLVRQRVGKALEGGVLRKEDEEKYKKILATLRDTPETAVYKIDALIKNVTRDIENYKQQQRLSGKRVADAPSTTTTQKPNPFRKAK